MDTKDTVETTPETAPAKPAPKPAATVPKEHPEERTASKFYKRVPTVPLSAIGEKEKSLDWSGFGATFEGLSVTSPESKEKRKLGKEKITK